MSKKLAVKRVGMVGLIWAGVSIAIGMSLGDRGLAAGTAGHGAANGHGGNAAAGRPVYDDKCAKCHGKNGDGKGRAGRNLDKPSTPFIDAAKLAKAPYKRMFDAIKFGGEKVDESADMKAYPDLSDEQIKDVLAYIYTLPNHAK